MKTKVLSRMTACLLAAAMLSLTACGKKEPGTSSSGTQSAESSSSGGSSEMNSEINSTVESESQASSGGGSSATTGGTTSKNTSSSSSPAKQTTQTIDISEYESIGNDTEVLSYALEEIALKSSVSASQGQNVKYILKLKKKNYKISSTLVISGANNVEIEGNGASLIFTNLVTALDLRHCTDLTFKNLTVDYDPLPFTQGVVKKINGNEYTVEIDKGYRTDVEFLNTSVDGGNIWSNVHDPNTGAVLDNTAHSYAYQNARSLGGRMMEITRTFPPEHGGRKIQVGDHVTFFQRAATTILPNDCTNTSFINFNLYSSPGFGINEGSGGGGMVLKNVKIVPGAKPSGATQARLRSTNGDGTHFGNVKKGPTFDGCTITHCGDDCINIQGFFFHVLKVSGNKITVTPKWDTPLEVGETIEGYKDEGYTSIGTAKIVKFEKRNDPSMRSQIIAAYNKYDSTIADDTLVYDIVLDKKLALTKGDHITSLDRIGAGAVIKNSTFKYNRARGVVVKGRDIVIENNTFEKNTHPAIVAHADILWCESGFPVNVKIRNNKITGSATSSNMIHENNIDQIGAILVSVAPPKGVTGFYNCFQNKNIVIEGNSITDSRVFGIAAINCDGITIKNNTITRPFCNGIGNVGDLYGITPKSGIFVGMSKNITVTGNTVVGGGKVSQAVEIYSNCSGIKANSGNTLK